MERPHETTNALTKMAGAAFEHTEHYVYVFAGFLVICTAAIACAGVITVLFQSALHFEGTSELVELIDRLLFVLMLVEILHTIHVSLRTGSLQPEPFLVVGLIASIRRVLVITLASSQQAQAKTWSDQAEAIFRASMIELGVLAVLISVLVVSLALVRRTHADAPRQGDTR